MFATDTVLGGVFDRGVCRAVQGWAIRCCRPDEQRGFDRAQLVGRLDTEVVDQSSALCLERFECIADSSGAMQGGHVMGGDSLVVRLAFDFGLDGSKE